MSASAPTGQETGSEPLLCVEGKVTQLRGRISKSLFFFELLVSNEPLAGAVVQVVVEQKLFQGSVSELRHLVRVRDTLQVKGHREESRKGVQKGISLLATQITVQRLDIQPERLLQLLGDSVHSRNGLTMEASCRLLRMPCDMFGPLTHVLKRQIEKREQNIRLSLAMSARKRAPMASPAEPVGICRTRRAERIASAAASRQRAFYVVLEKPQSPTNVAAIMRTCDAYGVTQLLVIAPRFDLEGDTLRRASASASHWVDVVSFGTVPECTGYLSTVAPGLAHYGTAVHSTRSLSLYAIDFCAPDITCAPDHTSNSSIGHGGASSSNTSGVALWFGNEAEGLSPEAQDCCPVHLFVPMRGMVESLNLSVCVGVVCSEVTRQRLASSPGMEAWVLPEPEREALDSKLQLRDQERRQVNQESDGVGESGGFL